MVYQENPNYESALEHFEIGAEEGVRRIDKKTLLF